MILAKEIQLTFATALSIKEDTDSSISDEVLMTTEKSLPPSLLREKSKNSGIASISFLKY